MTIRTTITRRITREEFEAVRDAAKAELNIRLSFTYHGKSAAKYARGMFDVKPVKKADQKYAKLSHEEQAIVLAWLRGKGFYIQSYTHENVIHSDGFSYITKVV